MDPEAAVDAAGRVPLRSRRHVAALGRRRRRLRAAGTYAFQLIRIKGVTEQLICERIMFTETDKKQNPL